MWSKGMKNDFSSRREWIQQAGKGFSGMALAAMMQAADHPMGRAKNVIYIFNHGGVSHVDTFDPKPTLTRLTGETVPASFAEGLKTSRIDFRKAIMRGSPWPFLKQGQSGLEISGLYPHLAKHADRLAVVRSCFGDAFDHAPAIFLRCTGSQFPGRPSVGSWISYGLGSENKNLPSFVVMSDGAMKSGAGAYGAGFLPASFQGTVFRGGKSPVLNLATPQGVTAEAQKDTLEFINDLNRRHFASREEDSTLDARIKSYELAYRMQAEAPGAVDISAESDATRKLYGVGEPMTDDFGRKCLLARRLVERGVRFVQLFFGTNLGDDWDDAHNDLWGSHNKMAKKSDRGAVDGFRGAGFAGFDAGGLEQRVRENAAGRGEERAGSSSLWLQHVDGGGRDSGGTGAGGNG
jgi:hypothetical protein